MLSILLIVAAAPQELPAELFKRCSRERLLHSVETLCELGPRTGGTTRGNASAAWVAHRLRGIGLSPVVVEDPERQVYEGRLSKLIATAAPGTARAESLELDSAVPFAYSPESAGVAYLSAALPTTGAFLGPRIPRPTETGPLRPAIILVDSGADYPRPRSLHPDRANQTPAISIGSHEGAWLRRAIAAGEEVELNWELEASSKSSKPRTVLASIPAREGAAPGFFLVAACAESDGGGEGMNGNASGVAVLLEVARAWGSAVREGKAAPPAREVRFAIWGARGYSARTWMARHERLGGPPLLGVLNLERLALSSAGHRLHLSPDNHPSNRELLNHAWERLDQAGGRHGIPQRWAAYRGRGDEDLRPFLRRHGGPGDSAPALTLFAAGASTLERVERTHGSHGESWRDSNDLTVPQDPMLNGRGDTNAGRIRDGGALLEAASRTALLVIPSWLEQL